MAKLNFEEYLKAMEGYRAYLNGEAKELPAIPSEEEEPKPAPEVAPAPEAAPAPMGPAEDYRAELNEIREQMKKMAAALSPSLGDVQPVGIEDVVTNFFKQS